MSVLKRGFFFFSDFFSTFRLREHLPSIAIIAAACLVILSCWVAVYFVDVLNLTSISPERGLWWHLFRNRGPVEWVQWIFISLTCLGAAVLCGSFWEKGEKRGQLFWGLIAITFILMLIEDAGDPRHVLANYGYELFGMKRRNIEGVYFALMASPLLYAFLRFREVIFNIPQTRLYIVVGGVLYAVAATASVFREYGDFYVNLGERLSQEVTGGVIPPFFLMDFVLEESLELFSAATIFAGVRIYWRLAGPGRKYNRFRYPPGATKSRSFR